MTRRTHILEHVNWVLDGDMLVQNPPEQNLANALSELGFEFEIHTNATGFNSNSFQPMWRDEGSGPTVAYGSQGFVWQFIRNIPCIPGAYPTNTEEVEKLRPSHYMSQFVSEMILNSDYVFMPIGSCIFQSDKLFNMFETDKLFVKDDQTFKRFSGEIISKEDWIFKLQLYKDVHRINDSDMILIAKPKKILSEHRFVVVDGKVIAQSTYKTNNTVDIKEKVPKLTHTFATGIAKRFKFKYNKPYTLDIAMVEENGQKKARVIEFNSFSCAGLYACNLKEVVKSISQQAINDYVVWEDSNYF